jgi:hypothetical protein
MRRVMVAVPLITLLWACNQIGIGVSQGLKNLASTPVSALRSGWNSLTGNTYSSYSKQTDELRKEEPDSCADKQAPEKGMFEKLKEAMMGVRDEACTCRPWGTCPPSNCECKVLCPDSFDIFSVHKERIRGRPEDEMVFGNSRAYYKNYLATNGYCWGHASMTAKFDRLAFFDATKKISASPSSAQWRDHYRGVIDRIAANEAVDIPGFKNLSEFSAHPTIQEMLADRIAFEWGEKAMTWSALAAGMDSGQMSASAAADLVRDLKRRTSLYQAPQIVFTKLGDKFLTHATLVGSVVDLPGGVARICLRDSNLGPAKRADCSNHFDVKPSGEIKGSLYGKIGGIRVPSNENAETIEQLHSLRKRCEKVKGCG